LNSKVDHCHACGNYSKICFLLWDILTYGSILIHMWFRTFFFSQYWGLNSEPHTCYVGTLPLEPFHQPLLTWFRCQFFFSCGASKFIFYLFVLSFNIYFHIFDLIWYLITIEFSFDVRNMIIIELLLFIFKWPASYYCSM
jgi:hypothetical protein